MSNPGFVYVLINPSLTGMVKIGKTTRDSETRAKELSSSTGVPTEFMVAFDIYVSDCTQAEEYLHTLLESKGYRLASNKEFFNAPLKEVIQAMLQIQDEFKDISQKEEIPPFDDQTGDETLDSLELEDYESPELWDDILELAESYFYGFDAAGDTLQDYEKALNLYKQAAKMGAPQAFLQLGEMYRKGKGCRENKQTALRYLKEGAQKGATDCWSEMALLFADKDHTENARKSWDKYFEIIDDVLTQESNKSDLQSYARYAQHYLNIILHEQLNTIPSNHRIVLSKLKNEIIDWTLGMIKYCKEHGLNDNIFTYERVIRYIKNNL